MAVYTVPGAGAFKMVADPAAVSWPKVIAILFILVLYVTMVYGPIAAILVEMFPTRIRAGTTAKPRQRVGVTRPHNAKSAHPAM